MALPSFGGATTAGPAAAGGAAAAAVAAAAALGTEIGEEAAKSTHTASRPALFKKRSNSAGAMRVLDVFTCADGQAAGVCIRESSARDEDYRDGGTDERTLTIG